MLRSCSTCGHKSEPKMYPFIDAPCCSCIVGSLSNGDIEYTKWEPAHSCSTCKHCNKKITEEPCLDCDFRVEYNSKWEARE